MPDMNTYINALSKHRLQGAEIKRVATDSVTWETKKYATRKLLPPYHITFNWYCKDRKKDKDNISSMGRKCILDGLQKSGVIPQDSWNVVDGFSDFFFLDKTNPRIEVIIKSLN